MYLSSARLQVVQFKHYVSIPFIEILSMILHIMNSLLFPLIIQLAAGFWRVAFVNQMHDHSVFKVFDFSQVKAISICRL